MAVLLPSSREFPFLPGDPDSRTAGRPLGSPTWMWAPCCGPGPPQPVTPFLCYCRKVFRQPGFQEDMKVGFKSKTKLGTAGHTWNPRTFEAEVGLQV